MPIKYNTEIPLEGYAKGTGRHLKINVIYISLLK